MKRILLLTTIGVLLCIAYAQSQNVFDPSDPIIRYNSGAALGSSQRPDPSINGNQKWVSVASSGVSFGSNSFDASSFKAYFLRVNNHPMAYRLKYPRSYNNPDSAGKKYPVMIFFHGAGEPGCPTNGGVYNNERQLLHGGRLFRDRVDNNQFDGFLIYPQAVVASGCWSDWGTPPSANLKAVTHIIDTLAKYVRADADRVITTGLSNGGQADWNMASVYPWKVTKTAPSAAATGADNFDEFVHIPIWFASGGKDTNPTPGYANAVYNNFKNAGGDINYTFYPDRGHSVWYQHWQEPGFVEWMNDMHKANPLVYFQRYDFCPDSPISVKIGITRGFYQYEWQKDGVTIATAVSTTSDMPGDLDVGFPYNTYNTSISNPSVVTAYTANDITVNAFGTYRVRFKRTPVSDWSDWSHKPAVIFSKPVTQTPAIALNGLHSNVLPAPDGSTTVQLELPEGYTRYEWYRNNLQVDTARVITATVGTYKAKAFEQFGCGSLFSPEYVVINAAGEPKPDAAKNLTATATSLTSIQLDWSANPNAGENETGYEIYRSLASGGPYQLLHITAPDVVSYTDQNLNTNTSYYYIVRAIGLYGAAASSNEATASTAADVTAPASPANLTAVCITREKVDLTWSTSSDNVGVTMYDIYVNGAKSYSTPNTRFSVNQLTPLQNYYFTVKARDAAGNVSQPSNQVSAVTKAQGLCYKVYEGTWSVLPDFSQLTPVKEGMSPTVDISVRPAGLNNNFGFLWEGHLFRQSTGSNTYRFRICSDDGSKLYFNGYYNHNATATLSNDGLHSNTCVTTGNITDLVIGQAYPLAVTYFENSGGESMSLNWRIGTSGSTYPVIPATAFVESFSPAGSAPAAPTGLNAAAGGYDRIDLSWNDNSNNETGFEIVRSMTSGGEYLPIATTQEGMTSYTDTGLMASTQYYYQVRAVNAIGASAFTASANATTQAAPPAPANPSGLVANVPALGVIGLTWNDNSTDETGFEIWRSTGDNLNFRLLTTVAAGGGGQQSYNDSGLFANVHYYYKVRAKGLVANSGFTSEVTAETPNTAPVINKIRNFTMRQGATFSLPVSATDVDGDPMTFTAPNLPYFGAIENVSNGNANIVLNPPIGEQGIYTIRVIVSDGFNGYDTTYYSMMVNDNSVPTLDSIGNVIMNEGDTLVIPVLATDLETTNYMQWLLTQKPSFANFVDSGNGHGAIVLAPGYAASGQHQVTLLVDDGFGAWATRSFIVDVNEIDPNETVQVNMRYFTGFQPLWNDVPLFGVSTFNVSNMINRKNQTTTVGINWVSGTLETSDGGMQPGGTGVYPDAIMKDRLKWGFNAGNNSQDNAQVRVYGLDPEKKYNFIFFASDNGNDTWRNFTANTATTYNINGQTAQVHIWQNTNETDTIYQVQPNASGEVFINMTGDPGSQIGGVLNALVIDLQFDDGTVPAKPTGMAAYVIPNVGVDLNWQDISYNENGYRIFRSTSQAGPYSQLTPNAEKDSAHYVDATVEPFTKYYYYVAGYNQYGEGAHSDTVSVTTGNNKPAINSLNNLFIKAGASGQTDFSVSDDPGDVVTVSSSTLPAFMVLQTLGGNNYRLLASPTADDIGLHNVIITATDSYGGVTTQSTTVGVADNNTRSFYVNFGYQAPAPTPWNNLEGYGNPGNTLNNLRDESGVATNYSVQLVNGWNGITDLGHPTGNNTGVFPDDVLKAGLWDGNAAARQVRFSNLNDAMRYNVVIVGSHNIGKDATAYYASGASTDTLNARYNSNLSANLNGLTPVGGVITVNMTKAASAEFLYLNGLQLEEYDPSITLMGPINLYAEPVNRTTVALSWSDRSNVETGYQLQRATDSLFTQNLATINLGANNTQYTNTGLTANTKYWYRVRAVMGGTNSTYSNRVKTITPQSIVSVNFNFSVDNGPFPWNNTEALPNFENTFSGFINHAGQPTGISLNIEKIFNGEYAFGLITGNNSGIVPDNVLQASYWIDNLQLAQVRLTGLNQAKRYRIGFVGNVDNTLFGGDNFTSTYTINGRTVQLNALLNTFKMVFIGDIVPDENGEVLIDISTHNGTIYGFTSAIVVQAYDDAQGGAVPNEVNPGITDPGATSQTVQNTTEENATAGSMTGARMYPNPFVDIVNLDFNNTSAADNIGVDVYDMSGKLVYRRNFGRLSPGYNTLRVNTAEKGLHTGLYIVTLTVNGKPVQATKMIKTKP